MVRSVTHAEREDDVLDEYPPAPLGVCCPAPLMSLSAPTWRSASHFAVTKTSHSPLALSHAGREAFL